MKGCKIVIVYNTFLYNEETVLTNNRWFLHTNHIELKLNTDYIMCKKDFKNCFDSNFFKT